MLLAVVYVLGGILLLYLGGDKLVASAASLALRLRISPLVIGLTVVAFGTSAPELAVSIKAALSDQGAIAAGNVLGSNICNICLILGMAALLSPIAIKTQLIHRDGPIMVLASGLLVYFLWDRQMVRWEAAVLFAGIVVYTWTSYRFSRPEDTEEVPDKPLSGSVVIDIVWLLVSVALLVIGSRFLVEGASTLARLVGLSEAVIGLTIVALGTSMPELATSVIAAAKKQGDISIGNIIGSNIFNVMCIMGLSPLVRPYGTPGIADVDLFLMLGVSILLVPLIWTGRRLSRGEGALLLVIYIGYVTYLLMRTQG